MTLLEVENLGIKFGGLAALQGASFSLKAKEIVAIIGPNGAGKTTLFNIITGVYEPTSGFIKIDDISPCEQLGLKKTCSILIAGLLTAVMLFVTLNVESIWQAEITSNYIYQQGFQWQNLIPNFSNFLNALSWRDSYGILLAGLILGSSANWIIWNPSCPEVVMKHGLARTFQNIRIFAKMSVLDNILVGMHCSLRSRLSNTIKSKKLEAQAKNKAEQILKFVGLEKSKDLNADKLSYGHQRRLEIARALATNPKLILLDEPAAGMNPSEAEELMNLIKKIRDTGVSVLLIEHHMKVVMGISDKIVVLNYGEKIAEGTPEEIKQNKDVIKAYLGA